MLRHVTAGVLGAALGVMTWLLAAVGIPFAIAFMRVSLDNTGAAGFGLSVDTGALAVAAVAGFGLGYYWSTRRVRRDTQTRAS